MITHRGGTLANISASPPPQPFNWNHWGNETSGLFKLNLVRLHQR